MEEEYKKDEEGLEDILEEMTEEELDKKLEETFKEDILSENEVETKFTHQNTAVVEDIASTLKKRDMMPIENLEDKLKEDDEGENNTLESQEIITYGMEEEEGPVSHYIKPKNETQLYSAGKIASGNDLEKVRSSSSISSEMAFVTKNTKPEYVKPEAINPNKPKDENKSKFIQDFKKLSDDYKTR